MTTALLFWTSLVAFLATCLMNLAHRSLRLFSRRDLEEICRLRGKPARFGEILREHEDVALGVEMATTFAAVFGVVSGVAWAGAAWHFALQDSPWRLAATVAAFGLTLVIFRTWIPWVASRLCAEGYLYFTWPAWRFVAAAATPLAWGARLLDVLLHRLVGRPREHIQDEPIEDEIRTIVSEGHREGLLEDEAREMIEGVIDMGDAYVSQIMTPRTDMHMAHVETPWDDLVADVIESGHTRIPVFDKTRDDIIGILYSKDLLPELATGDPASRTPLRDMVRKPLFVPETKAVNDVLAMFQQLRTHIAVVLDEYGGVSGLVTIEDVLEEIVGEIDDEYDPESVAEIDVVDENTCEALGRAHIDEINSRMHLELPEDGDYDTIGGLVFSELGRVPQAGESVVWQEKVRISVLEASKRRIDRVRIERLENGQRESA